jgi:2-methylfumaryl-CoA hydratase
MTGAPDAELSYWRRKAAGSATSMSCAGAALRWDDWGTATMSKAGAGNFFEDFRLGQLIEHATPRTVTTGDVALYNGLFGGRFAVQSADAFARAIGYPRAPIDDLLVFHFVFGKTVPDISLNAVANLGYAGCRFLAPVYPGETLNAQSEIIGLKENSSRKTGIVFVRSSGSKADGSKVLEYVRWVMLRKRDPAAQAAADHVPRLPEAVLPSMLGDACPRIDTAAYDFARAGSRCRFGDYAAGEKIDHIDGVTVEEAEHQIATRLYQNTARIHFNQFSEAKGRFGRRLIYGGHVISLARSLSFNGLANAFHIAAINGGRHAAPLFAGSTVFAWSQVLAKADLPARDDVGALRLRTVATMDHPCSDFPLKVAGEDHPAVLLDLDYWALIPK